MGVNVNGIERKEKSMACPLCPQPCSTAWNLKIHIQRKHHWKGESVKSGLMTNTTDNLLQTLGTLSSSPIAIPTHPSESS